MKRLEDRAAIIAKLSRFLAGHPSVRLAYLFGSVASGRQTQESDVDVAVLFDGGYTYDTVVHLQGALTDLLRREVDLVALNDCNPLVAKAATEGILVWCRSKLEPLYYRAQADREAHDWMEFINSYLALLRKREASDDHGTAPDARR